MKRFSFLFIMLASITAGAAVKITPLGTNYSAVLPTVTFKVEWTTTPYNNRVWVWIDFCPVTGTTPATSFSTATISNPQKTGGNGTITETTARGFFIEYGATNAGTTVTATLSNAPSGKFNWCVYGSDYPPNAAITTTGYQLKGSPPFTITYNNGNSTVTYDKTFDLGCINTLTDATGCPGLIETLSAPTSSTNGARCNSGTINISATPPSGSTIDWYTTASGTTKVTNGTGVTTLTTPSISTTTNYYAASRHLITGCISSSRRTVTATVTNGSGIGVAPNSCGCADGLTSCSGTCRNLAAVAAICYNGREVRKGPYSKDWPLPAASAGWTLYTDVPPCEDTRDIMKSLNISGYVWCTVCVTQLKRNRTTQDTEECVRSQEYYAYWLEYR
jgi:hypothetical protein